VAKTGIGAAKPKEKVNDWWARSGIQMSSGFLHSPFGFDSGEVATVKRRCNTAVTDESPRKVRRHIDNPTNSGIAMNQTLFSTALTVCLATVTAAALAAPAGEIVGPYAGVGLGTSQVGTTGVIAQKLSSDETDSAARIYAGYHLTDHFGIEAGYVRLGKLQDRFRAGSADVSQTANARSLYLAGTGRLPLGAGFALTGKAGLSFGKASGTDNLGGSDSLIGSRTSAVLGVGAEYRLNRDVAFTVDLDTFGKVSKRVAASALTAGVRLSF
jgi:OOP family OmpA-OmpF porin